MLAEACELLEPRCLLSAAPRGLAPPPSPDASANQIPWESAPFRATAPVGATVLFDGDDASHWRRRDNGAAITWDVVDGALVAVEGAGDVRSTDAFTDFQLHLEFNVPATPAGTAEQDRGNSGVGLAGSYEVQVLDSFGRTLSGANDVGAIYGIRDADVNASFRAGQWQNYDVVFRAPRWSGSTKTEDARASVWLNGTLIQDDVEIPTSTFTFDPEEPGPRPITLQEHGNAVRFRNIWVEALSL